MFKILLNYIISFHIRGVAQPGSASVLGTEGRRFKSCLPDQFSKGGFMRIFFIFSFSMFFVLSNVKASYQDAVELANKKDYKKSISEFIKVAKESDDKELKSKSMFNVAVMYENGLGVIKNTSLAVVWYKSSAENNNKIAQYNLGWMHYHGDLVEKDYFKAFKYYEMSANQGYSKAQFNLANLHFSGLGTTKDLIQAYKWFKISSSNGISESQQYLNFIKTQIPADELFIAEKQTIEWIKNFRVK